MKEEEAVMFKSQDRHQEVESPARRSCVSKTQPYLEAVEVTAKKFVRPFKIPWKVIKLLSASTHEFAYMNCRARTLSVRKL
jgi:hypothetical protein